MALFTSQRRRERLDAERRAELVAALRDLHEPERKRRPWGRAALRTGWAVGWRFRRQLAPLWCLAALWALGAIVDKAGTPAPGVALLAALGALAAWRLRYARRLDRPAERRYAALCLVGAAAWLVLVAAHGLH